MSGQEAEKGKRNERNRPSHSTHENPRLSSGDYTPYFDDVMLDRMINEWFEEQALAPAA